MSVVPSLELSGEHKIPVVGLGTWKSKKGQVEKAVESAIECGYRHIDCAWIYQNENEVGEAITAKIKDKTVERKDLFITGKLWNTFHNPKDVRPALLESLRKLQTDYLDLYLIHWPFCYINNGESFPKDEDGNLIYDNVDYVKTWKAMEDLKTEGLVRNIGVSNFNIFQLKRVLNEGSIPPAVNQVELHPYLLQTELIDFCKEKGIVVTAYSPLGSPDRPWAKNDEPVLMENPKLKEIASRLNKTTAQILIRFQVQRGLTVIPKSVTPARIQSNFEVFDFELTTEDMNAIKTLNIIFRACTPVVDNFPKYFPFQDNYTE